MVMLIVTLTLIAAFLGSLAGSLSGQVIRRLRSRREQRRLPVSPVIDRLTAAEIDQAAAAWAAAHGKPAAGGLLADKLRLAFGLRPPSRPFDQDEPRWRP
jgi:hypothetical protein